MPELQGRSVLPAVLPVRPALGSFWAGLLVIPAGLLCSLFLCLSGFAVDLAVSTSPSAGPALGTGWAFYVAGGAALLVGVALGAGLVVAGRPRR